jgi:hypothetical protein
MVNPEMMAEIVAAVEAADIEGYDYLELKQSLKNMAALPLTEEQKIAAAFATVANQTSREKILDSITHYIGIVDKSESSFMETAAQKEIRDIGGRDEKIKQIDADLQKKSDMIVQLTAEITKLQEDKSKISQEKVEKQLKIDNVRASYKATAQQARDGMLSDKAKIERAIPLATPPQA